MANNFESKIDIIIRVFSINIYIYIYIKGFFQSKKFKCFIVFKLYLLNIFISFIISSCLVTIKLTSSPAITSLPIFNRLYKYSKTFMSQCVKLI